jgi:hypothetical protein
MIGRSSLGIAWLALAATACYPDRSVDSTTEFASVTTLFDNQASFQTITKYALPDTVIYVPKLEGKEVPAVTQQAILSAIRTNLNTLGWTEVVNARTTPVDVYVTAAVASNTYVGWVYDYWGYWGWYPYWPPGYGGGSGWYYPGYWYPYSYTTGSVILGMVDARAQPGTERVPLIWTGAVNGVLADATSNIAIATAGINQAFEQSPYLKTGVAPK